MAIAVGNISQILQIAANLRENNIFASAIRPPPVFTPRIRITLMASPTPDQIQFLLQCLQA